MGPSPPAKPRSFGTAGPMSPMSHGVAIRGAYTIFGPYRIPNIELISQLVYTNKEISGSYRGYGTTQVTWACESQMDMIAHRLGIDPLEIRLRNAYVEGDPYINGQVLHGVGLKETSKGPAGRSAGGRRENSLPLVKASREGNGSHAERDADPYEFLLLYQGQSGCQCDRDLQRHPRRAEDRRRSSPRLPQTPLAFRWLPSRSPSPIPPSHLTMTQSRSSRTTFHMGNAVLMRPDRMCAERF